MFCAIIAALYIFSADGQTPGSGERELPQHGVELATGRLIIALPAKTDRERAACGWYRLGERPANFAVTGYSFNADGTATRLGHAVEPRPRAENYSKLKLCAALTQAGLWDSFENWLKSQEIGGMSGWTAFLLAQELTSDHPLFAQYYEAAIEALGIDRAAADQMLEACRL